MSEEKVVIVQSADMMVYMHRTLPPTLAGWEASWETHTEAMRDLTIALSTSSVD